MKVLTLRRDPILGLCYRHRNIQKHYNKFYLVDTNGERMNHTRDYYSITEWISYWRDVGLEVYYEKDS